MLRRSRPLFLARSDNVSFFSRQATSDERLVFLFSRRETSDERLVFFFRETRDARREETPLKFGDFFVLLFLL